MAPHITYEPDVDADPAPEPTLVCDRSGVLWLDYDGLRERLGFIEDADAPAGMEAEAARLLDDWRDAAGGGHEQAAHAAWAFSRGV